MRDHLIKFFYIFTLTTGCLFLVSGCGDEESDSSAIEVSNLPSKPIVINNNFSYPLPDHTEDEPSLKQVTGPWFKVGFQFINNSDKKLIIATFNAEVSAVGNNSVAQYSPSLDEIEEDRIYLTQPALEPGETRTPEVVFYFDALPATDSSSYSAEITFTGFFLEPEAENDLNPIGRFEKKIRFRTE